MKLPQRPKNEDERLKSLLEYDILDTPPEQAFDDLTFLASVICDCPVALVSLIDKDRQWFKSRVGIDATETPRDYAFCAHAILENEIFVVNDAKNDERFFDNPLVAGDADIRFYAGTPLISADGHALGTLCVVDRKPRQLTKAQAEALEALGRQVQHQLRLRIEIKRKAELTAKVKADSEILRSFFDSSPHYMGIIALRENEITNVTANRATTLFFKSSKESGAAEDIRDLPASFRIEFGAAFEEAKKTQRPVLFTSVLEVAGQTKRIRSVANYIGEDEKSQSLCSFVAEDITAEYDREKLIRDQQMKIIASNKLSSLGEMAGGVAHEINNPLAIIIGKSVQMKDAIASGRADHAYLASGIEKIHATSERIAKIVKGLRTFSRDGDRDPMIPASAKVIIEDTLALCQERFRSKGVDVRLRDLTDESINCRPVQISQVLLNLFNNAYDATAEQREPWIEIKAQLAGTWVEFTVTDSGQGIPPETAERLMQPFFTTKPTGQGTGLGLSIAKGIAEAHGGSLTYDASSLNTRFVLRLPAYAAKQKLTA